MLFEAYTTLVRGFPAECESLYGSRIKQSSGLWLAVDPYAFPSFLIASDMSDIRSDIELRFVSVNFSRDCEITTDAGDTACGTFTIVRLEENEPDLVRLFLRLLEEAFCGDNAPESNRAIGERILDLANLFRQVQNSSKDTLGLWGELFVISNATSPESAAARWCQHRNAKYDFVGDKFALEVKATLKASREHRFSIEQLRPSDPLTVFIASLQLVKTQSGKPVFELVDEILSRIVDAHLRKAFLELCVIKGGEDIYKNSLRYQLLSRETGVAYYDASEIPVPIVNDGELISNVKFDVRLDTIPSQRGAKRARLISLVDWSSLIS